MKLFFITIIHLKTFFVKNKIFFKKHLKFIFIYDIIIKKYEIITEKKFHFRRVKK